MAQTRVVDNLVSISAAKSPTDTREDLIMIWSSSVKLNITETQATNKTCTVDALQLAESVDLEKGISLSRSQNHSSHDWRRAPCEQPVRRDSCLIGCYLADA